MKCRYDFDELVQSMPARDFFLYLKDHKFSWADKIAIDCDYGKILTRNYLNSMWEANILAREDMLREELVKKVNENNGLLSTKGSMYIGVYSIAWTYTTLKFERILKTIVKKC